MNRYLIKTGQEYFYCPYIKYFILFNNQKISSKICRAINEKVFCGYSRRVGYMPTNKTAGNLVENQ